MYERQDKTPWRFYTFFLFFLLISCISVKSTVACFWIDLRVEEEEPNETISLITTKISEKNRFDRKIAKQLHEVIPTTQMYHCCIPRLFLLLPNHMEEKHLNIRFWWGILYNRVWNNFSQCCITPYTIFITSSEIIILYTNLINIYYQSFCCVYMLSSIVFKVLY